MHIAVSRGHVHHGLPIGLLHGLALQPLEVRVDVIKLLQLLELMVQVLPEQGRTGGGGGRLSSQPWISFAGTAQDQG